MINIPNTDLYIRSIETNDPGISDICASPFDEKNSHEFYFNLSKTHFSTLDIKEVDRRLSEVRRGWMFTKTKTLQKNNQTDFVLIYKEMRRIIHWFLKVVQQKEPNTFKDQFFRHMCINGKIF